MKKRLIFLVLTFILLLTGCTEKPVDPIPHTTTMNYCRWGDNYYFYGYFHGRFNAALDSQVSLCLDPLCTHMAYNQHKKVWYSLCPLNLDDVSSTFTSDGRYIYMAARAENEDPSDTMTRAIYRFPADNPADMKRIAVYSTTGPLFGAPIYCFDGMIYYVQGMYNSDYVPGITDGVADQYMQIMLVKASGGVGEPALDRKFPADCKFYMDEHNFYIIDYNGPLTIIDRTTGELTEVRPDGLSPSMVYTVDGVQYLICNEETHTVTFAGETPVSVGCVYRYENGEYTKIAGNLAQQEIIDGALWYIPYELTYYGSRDSFNGRETVMEDYFSHFAGELHRLDLSTGEETVWQNEDPDLDLWFVGAMGSTAIVAPRSVAGEYNGEQPWREPMFWKAQLGEDGIIRLLCGIEERSIADDL